jgi:hypothetical protein
MAYASTSVVTDQKRYSLRSLKILSRALAATVVLDNVEAELLAFHDRAQTSAFDGGDVDENVRAAIVGLDEAEALGRIEELDGSDSHDDFLLIGHGRLPAVQKPDRRLGRFWERKIVSGAIGAKTKFSSKIDGAHIALNYVHCKAASTLCFICR